MSGVGALIDQCPSGWSGMGQTGAVWWQAGPLKINDAKWGHCLVQVNHTSQRMGHSNGHTGPLSWPTGRGAISRGLANPKSLSASCCGALPCYDLSQPQNPKSSLSLSGRSKTLSFCKTNKNCNCASYTQRTVELTPESQLSTEL